jgi:hypothetical protein
MRPLAIVAVVGNSLLIFLALLGLIAGEVASDDLGTMTILLLMIAVPVLNIWVLVQLSRVRRTAQQDPTTDHPFE